LAGNLKYRGRIALIYINGVTKSHTDKPDFFTANGFKRQGADALSGYIQKSATVEQIDQYQGNIHLAVRSFAL